MLLDFETCYRALRARDARFDGRFFVGVSTTRIYCRPICPVKPPKRENIGFYPSAAAAEAVGYRPCLRCRPELAPGNASVDSSRCIAHAAATLIEDEAQSETGLDAISERLGVTDRHLRRVFQSEFGVAPVAFAQTQRLLLAKRLLTDTSLSVTDIAFASGFGSLRRFEALFQERYRLSPKQLRKYPKRSPIPDSLAFELSFRPPYDWPAMLRFLGARSIAGVEEISGSSYRRIVSLSQKGWLEVAPHKAKPTLRVTVSASLAKVLPAVLARVKHLFDLSCQPLEIADVLGPLAAANPGLRVPGAFDGFEVATRAILGQQVSVAAARTLAGRIAAAYGTPVESPFPALTTAFPSSRRLAELQSADLAKLGVMPARARTIVELAQTISERNLRLAPGMDAGQAIERLKSIPGIGEWTAQYIAMRALGWPDAFPHTDLAVMKALGERNPRGALAAGETWRPWRAYAVMHLWATIV